MPAIMSRCAIHAGDSPIVTPPPDRGSAGSRSGASTTTVMSSASPAASAVGSGSGTSSGSPKCAARSRATPDDRHRVGPVRRDREVEHDLVEAEHVADVGAELGVGVEARGSRRGRRRARARVPSTACRRTRLAADLAPLEREPAGQRRARRRVRHDHPGDDVRRAAHDGRGAGAEVDVDELELVGVRMLAHLEDLPATRRR